jgi:hypothetical protein
VSPVKYELGFYIPEDDILHSHRRENLKSYKQIVIECIRIDTPVSLSVRITLYLEEWCLQGCYAVWLL